jgi:choline dehydrogenase-like flavoprotein
VVTLGRYRPKEDWYDKDDKPFKPFIHYTVGGNSKMYGAALFRFRERDFEEVQHYGGLSPEWPLKYDAYENYYEQAENCTVCMANVALIPVSHLQKQRIHCHRWLMNH